MAGNTYRVEGAVSAVALDGMKSGRASPFPTQPAPTQTEKVQTGVIEQLDARNRRSWERTKYQKLGISDHYTHVAALIVHWAKDLDEGLQSKEEV